MDNNQTNNSIIAAMQSAFTKVIHIIYERYLSLHPMLISKVIKCFIFARTSINFYPTECNVLYTTRNCVMSTTHNKQALLELLHEIVGLMKIVVRKSS